MFNADFSSVTYHQHYPGTGNRQEYWQVKCERVTLKASLIPPALGKPALDWTRLLAGGQDYWQVDKTIGRCTNVTWKAKTTTNALPFNGTNRLVSV